MTLRPMRTGVIVIFAGAMLLTGCHHRKQAVSELELQYIHTQDPGLKDECLDKIRWGGLQALTGPQEDCYKFDRPRAWKGLWFRAFEVSRFCPEPASVCSDDTPGQQSWLEFGPAVHLPSWNGDTTPALFAVDFVGHKTTYPGAYGHQGQYDEEIVVDRLISMKRIDGAKKK